MQCLPGAHDHLNVGHYASCECILCLCTCTAFRIYPAKVESVKPIKIEDCLLRHLDRSDNRMRFSISAYLLNLTTSLFWKQCLGDENAQNLLSYAYFHLRHYYFLQSMVGIQDLGKLFYKPINDSNGSIVLAIVNQMQDPKQIGNLTSAVKWQSQTKLMKNSPSTDPLLPLLNVCRPNSEDNYDFNF